MLTVRMVGDRRAGQCEKHFSLLPSPNTLYYLLRDHMCVLLFSSVVVNSGVPTILENTDFRGSEDLRYCSVAELQLEVATKINVWLGVPKTTGKHKLSWVLQAENC